MFNSSNNGLIKWANGISESLNRRKQLIFFKMIRSAQVYLNNFLIEEGIFRGIWSDNKGKLAWKVLSRKKRRYIRRGITCNGNLYLRANQLLLAFRTVTGCVTWKLIYFY